MAINVLTNVSSLNAQRNLNKSTSMMNQALQRLSSGMRINSASDDAAGMAISNGLISQINGMNQAIRNANDGVSLLGTAEGSIVEQTNLLQRIRELAVQSATDTNSNANRKALNNEATQLKNELDRIAKTVEFNGIKLLDGTFTAKDLQVGAYTSSNERISIDIQSARAADIGSAYKLTGTASVTTTALSDGGVTITSGGTTTNIGATVDDGLSVAGGTYSALAKANAINAKSSEHGVSAEASTEVTGGATQAAGTIDSTNSLTINDVQIADTTIGAAGDLNIVTAINAKYLETGVRAELNSSNEIVLTADDGRNIEVTTAGTAHTTTGLNGSATTVVNRGELTLRSADAFTVAGSEIAALGTGVSGTATEATDEDVSQIDLTSKDGARLAVKIIDVALQNLNDRRANIGALTNRINTTIANLGSAVENASSANSRIVDADFAAETAAMSKAQILQQAGVSILSQANQTPQLALSLLR